MVALTVAIALALILPAVFQGTPTTRPTPTTQSESPAQENLALAQASLFDHTRSAPTGLSSPQPAGSSPVSGYRWTNASYAVGAVAPSYRSNPEMAWDAADGYVLLFGGNSVTGALETDTWTYLNGTWTNITSSVIGHPPPIARAFMNYDPSTNSVILFGGYLLGVSYVNYTWSYHKDKWTNLTSTADGPPTSDFTSVASDPSDGELLAVVESNIEQTWTFKDGSWANITASAPPPLQPDSPSSVPFGLSPDPAEGGVLMLSEYQTVSGFFGATYLFKAGTWQNLTDQSPNAPLYPYGIVPWVADPLSYLPSATAVLFYETLSMNQIGLTFPFSETWMFSSGRWTNISGPAGAGPDPDVVAPSAGAVDPADSAFVTFGGITSLSLLIPTWILSAPPVVNVSATPEATDVGLPVHLRGNVTFGLEPNNASWSFGDG